MLRLFMSALVVVAAIAVLAGPASAEGRRIALLVGNSTYSSKVGALTNPGNDIRGIRDALIAAGFRANDIRMVANASRLDLKREVDAFAARASDLSSSDIAFFYYSGHGAWRPGSRSMSLIPVDAADASTDDFWYSTVSLDDEILRAFHGSRSLAAWVIAIDACRNELRLPTRNLGGGDKAFQALPSQAGMLISFAADEGQTARDVLSGSSYSPYATALIESLAAPGLSLSAVFGGLRPAVMGRTGGAQQPVLTNKLNVDPVLNEWPVAPPNGQIATPGAPQRGNPAPALPPSTYLDARTTPATTRAPLISSDPASLPDFALFRECDGCPEMVILPMNAFVMGSTDGAPNETPVRQVNVKRFAISRFETTWDEWDACVDAGACNPGGPQRAGGDNGWGKGRRPVIEVNWNDARVYAQFVAKTTNANYRLPSEAEWEYAARSGSRDRYSWGASNPICDPTAQYGANFSACTDDQSRPVGSFKANSYGVFDLHGNVMEWVLDTYVNGYAAGQPTDGSAFAKGSGLEIVIRGGGWHSDRDSLRASRRIWNMPSFRDSALGFRLARTL